MQEFLVIQNYALGALALHSYTKSYYKEKKEECGPSLALMFPILPIVFNERSAKCLSEIKRVTQSRFLTTLSDYRDLPIGLQHRMIEMSDQTFKSLNLAFASNILSYNSSTGEILPIKRVRKLPKLQYKDNQDIIYASKVLGAWFANYTVEEICISLNIVF